MEKITRRDLTKVGLWSSPVLAAAVAAPTNAASIKANLYTFTPPKTLSLGLKTGPLAVGVSTSLVCFTVKAVLKASVSTATFTLSNNVGWKLSSLLPVTLTSLTTQACVTVMVTLNTVKTSTNLTVSSPNATSAFVLIKPTT